MITFVKLGGSLVTDKRIERSYRSHIVERLGAEIKAACAQRPDIRLLLSHGSGSFGHFPAAQFNTIMGVQTPSQWQGFAQVAITAAALHDLITQTLSAAGLPIWPVQPSASAICNDGVLQSLALHPITTALDNRLIPLIHGDVAVDTVRGGTIISTEQLLNYLAQHLPVRHIILLGETDGVYDQRGHVIPRITPDTYPAIAAHLTGAQGTDVTGGMLSKVQQMLALVQGKPDLKVRIANGTQPGLLQALLTDEATAAGTLIEAE